MRGQPISCMDSLISRQVSGDQVTNWNSDIIKILDFKFSGG